MIGELSVVTAPSGEPVTLTEAKAHLRAGDDEDTLIYGLIATAREVCEPKAGRAFLTQTLKMVYPCWPTGQRPYFELLRGPIQSISSVKYYDTSNTLQTMPATDYFADLTVAPARIWLGDGKMWPSASLRLGAAVEVTYVAGYSAASAVPRRYKQAMLLLVGHWYENREAVVVSPGATSVQLPFAIESLLTSGRGSWL